MLTEHICPPGSLSPLMNVRVTWSLNQILIILYRQEGKRFSFFFCFKIVWKSFVDSKSHVQLFYSYHWGRKWPRQRQRLKMSESQWQDRNWDWKIWVSMIRLGKRCRYQDSKYLGQKKFGPRKMWFTKIKPPKNWAKKFVVKIRAVIAEIWLQWINVTSHICCCLDKYHRLKIVPGTYLLSLVKIGSVTAEILLIWTIVSRTYMLPGQMSP